MLNKKIRIALYFIAVCSIGLIFVETAMACHRPSYHHWNPPVTPPVTTPVATPGPTGQTGPTGNTGATGTTTVIYVNNSTPITLIDVKKYCNYKTRKLITKHYYNNGYVITKGKKTSRCKKPVTTRKVVPNFTG